MPSAPNVRTVLRVRLGLLDTHYPGGLIPGATIARLLADCASEVGIRMDGVDNYLGTWESLKFLKPVKAGDFLELSAQLESKGTRSRRIAVEARRVIRSIPLESGLSAGEVLEEPELVATGTMITVLPSPNE